MAKLAEASAKRKAAEETKASAENAKKAAEDKAIQLMAEVADQLKAAQKALKRVRSCCSGGSAGRGDRGLSD